VENVVEKSCVCLNPEREITDLSVLHHDGACAASGRIDDPPARDLRWLTLWSDHADGGNRSRDTAALQIRIVVK
jgi:hypothetical protein